MSATLKTPAFCCRLVTAINVLNAAIKQYIVYPRFVQVVSCQWF